jgi:hypothetical protein
MLNARDERSYAVGGAIRYDLVVSSLSGAGDRIEKNGETGP